jgi:hypothetical protein
LADEEQPDRVSFTPLIKRAQLDLIRLRSVVEGLQLHFFVLPLGADFVCERSEAATDISAGVLLGLLKILLASDASFLPVAIVFTSSKVSRILSRQ